MKKILFAVVAVAFLAMGSMVNASNCKTVKNYSEEMVQSGYSVTVMWIRSNNGSLWIKTRKTGNYDSNENTITIGKSTYRVSENPYYGEEDSHGRGAYRYVAGGEYYFNL